jgi:16S rRNA U1498 N3-methylase RsmE
LEAAITPAPPTVGTNEIALAEAAEFSVIAIIVGPERGWAVSHYRTSNRHDGAACEEGCRETKSARE